LILLATPHSFRVPFLPPRVFDLEALVEFLPPRQSLRLPRSENINGFRSGCKRRNHIADFEACRRPS